MLPSLLESCNSGNVAGGSGVSIVGGGNMVVVVGLDFLVVCWVLMCSLRGVVVVVVVL